MNLLTHTYANSAGKRFHKAAWDNKPDGWCFIGKNDTVYYDYGHKNEEPYHYGHKSDEDWFEVDKNGNKIQSFPFKVKNTNHIQASILSRINKIVTNKLPDETDAEAWKKLCIEGRKVQVSWNKPTKQWFKCSEESSSWEHRKSADGTARVVYQLKPDQ